VLAVQAAGLVERWLRRCRRMYELEDAMGGLIGGAEPFNDESED
jgi:hypothetical protein